ncbi:MAG: hypothetical protein VYB40_05685 [Candidatus Thermoplasmatota archaeon]|nr:hypothetical protein [Candidatus Thermoplasmatota archaeon]
MAKSRSPHARLEKSLLDFHQGQLPGPIPKRWEKFSDLVILPEMSFPEGLWHHSEELWTIVAEALQVQRVAIMGEVRGQFRESGVKLLRGDDDWIVRREHGIEFGYHFTKCMWSAGNVTERGRIANADFSGENVLDLYAGIGYYTLPFLSEGTRGPNGQRGKGRSAKHVVACEWNPTAIECLRWSLNQNGVADKCTIIEGDNRDVKFEAIFDRVNLGLLPSAEEGYGKAIGALKPTGGTLHVHGLAIDGEEEKTAREIAAQLTSLGNFECEVTNIEYVKWYAPHKRHIVVDITAR